MKLSEIEFDIEQNKLTAKQVFVAMMQHIRLAESNQKEKRLSITFTLNSSHNKELELMDLFDQVMKHYHGIGVGVPLIDDKETRRAIERLNEEWMPSNAEAMRREPQAKRPNERSE